MRINCNNTSHPFPCVCLDRTMPQQSNESSATPKNCPFCKSTDVCVVPEDCSCGNTREPLYVRCYACRANGPVGDDPVSNWNAYDENQSTIKELQYAIGFILEVVIKDPVIRATPDAKGWNEKCRQFFRENKATIKDLQERLEKQRAVINEMYSELKDMADVMCKEGERRFEKTAKTIKDFLASIPPDLLP